MKDLGEQCVHSFYRGLRCVAPSVLREKAKQLARGGTQSETPPRWLIERATNNVTTCTPKRGIQATSKVLSQPEQKEANRASRANDTDAVAVIEATCLEGLLAEGGRHRWHHPQVHRSSDDALEHVGRRAANHPREGGVGGAHHARPSVSRPRLQPVYA